MRLQRHAVAVPRPRSRGSFRYFRSLLSQILDSRPSLVFLAQPRFIVETAGCGTVGLLLAPETYAGELRESVLRQYPGQKVSRLCWKLPEVMSTQDLFRSVSGCLPPAVQPSGTRRC